MGMGFLDAGYAWFVSLPPEEQERLSKLGRGEGRIVLPDVKVYHKADKMNQRGGVSALCYKRPRSIDLRRAMWTIRDEAVTCKKCLAVMQEN